MTTLDPTSASLFYITGGTIPPDAPSYIPRQADAELLTALRRGEICYVLNARQMGKSSLCVRTRAALENEGVRTAFLDLQKFGSSATAEQWYRSLLERIGHDLKLRTPFLTYWRDNAERTPIDRLFGALRDVALEQLPDSLVFFLDEIDVVRDLDFKTDEFFAAIRQCYNARAQDPAFSRLTFCIIGTVAPTDLIRDIRLSPFNIGTRIRLADFTSAEAAPLAEHLSGSQTTLQRVLWWTAGHPYLTQRLCAELSKSGSKDVDGMVAQLFMSRSDADVDENIKNVRNAVLRMGGEGAGFDRVDLLTRYAQIVRGKRVVDDDTDGVCTALRLSGMVKSEKGLLQVRNRVYAKLFDAKWVASHLPDAEVRRQRIAFRRGVVTLPAILSALMLLFYIVWGIPVYKSPQVRLTVKFGNLPEGILPTPAALWGNLKLDITPMEKGQPTGQTTTYLVHQKECDFSLPGHWYGYRFFFGIHGPDEQFQAKTSLVDASSMQSFFSKYKIDGPLHVLLGSQNEQSVISTDTGDIFTIDHQKITDKVSIFGDLIVSAEGVVLPKQPIHIKIIVDDSGAATPIGPILIRGTINQQSDQILVNPKLQNKRFVAEEELSIQAAGLLHIDANIESMPGWTASSDIPNVSPGVSAPFLVSLKFHNNAAPIFTVPGIAGLNTGRTGVTGQGSSGHLAAGPATTGPLTSGTGGHIPVQNPEQPLTVEMMKTFKSLVAAVVSNQSNSVKDNAATASMSAAQAINNLHSGDVWNERAYAILGYGYLQKTAIAPDSQKSDLTSKAYILINQTYDKEKSNSQVDSLVQLIHECVIVDKIEGESPDKQASDAKQAQSDINQFMTQSPSLEPFLQGFAYYYLYRVTQEESALINARKSFKKQGIALP